MNQTIKWETRRFDELSLAEMYSLLRLRAEVFIVEQNCVYQDIDNKDQKAIHLLGKHDNEIVAYARLFKPKDYFEEASIGRVVVKKENREKNMGKELMKEAIKGIEFYFGEKKITISAQLYLKNFYQSLGFIPTSEVYLEDDIPHIQMKKQE